jgi:hypothetical protein
LVGLVATERIEAVRENRGIAPVTSAVVPGAECPSSVMLADLTA